MYQYIKSHKAPIVDPKDSQDMRPVVVLLTGWEELKDQFQAESLWCENIDDRYMRVLNIPFYAYGISLGDEISLRFDNEEWYFDRVVKSAGNATIRILFKNLERADDILNQLKGLQCLFERDTESYFAISVPPAAYSQVMNVLDSSVDKGVLKYEVSHPSN